MPSRPRRFLALAALVLAGGVATLAATGCNSMGEHPAGAELERIRQSPEWHDARFENTQPMWGDLRHALSRVFDSTPEDVPSTPVPVVRTDPAQLAATPASGLRVTWFGHSSTLIEIDGVRVLTDPIWSDRASPVEWAGPRRWYPPTIALDRLPAIDAVFISHDHYDHLDAATIVAMRGWKSRFVVPLGLGAHLAHWGIPAERIVELDWWLSTRIGELVLTLTPSRHHSGRLSPQSDLTLWGGIALAGPAHRVYYSGDTGLLDAMNDIGTRLGPFDLALIEAGQYDADWPDWHLGPEQAVIAAGRVRAKALMPVHWGLFKLAHHTWTEPVERVLAGARCTGLAVLTPRPGEPIEPAGMPPEATPKWWPDTAWRTAAEKPVVATRDGVGEHRVAPLRCGGGA